MLTLCYNRKSNGDDKTRYSKNAIEMLCQSLFVSSTFCPDKGNLQYTASWERAETLSSPGKQGYLVPIAARELESGLGHGKRTP